MEWQKIVLERLGDASFLLSLVPFLKGNGLRNSISFGEPKLYVIQLRLGVCVLHTRVKRKQTNEKKKKDQTERKKQKTLNQTAAERKHNAVPFSKKPGMSWRRASKLLFQEMETKLNLQNFFTRPCLLATWLKRFNLCYTFMLLAEHKRGLWYWSSRTPLLLSLLPSKGSFPLW